jgi:hypothetical protein
MRRSDHPSGFSSFDPKTLSFAKLIIIIIIIIAYHHKCDNLVIIVKDTINSNSHDVRFDWIAPTMSPPSLLQQQLTL